MDLWWSDSFGPSGAAKCMYKVAPVGRRLCAKAKALRLGPRTSNLASEPQANDINPLEPLCSGFNVGFSYHWFNIHLYEEGLYY